MKDPHGNPVLLSRYGGTLWKRSYIAPDVTKKQIEVVARRLKIELDDLRSKLSGSDLEFITYRAVAEVGGCDQLTLGPVVGMGPIFKDNERKRTLSRFTRDYNFFCFGLSRNFRPGSSVDLVFEAKAYKEY